MSEGLGYCRRCGRPRIRYKTGNRRYDSETGKVEWVEWRICCPMFWINALLEYEHDEWTKFEEVSPVGPSSSQR